MKSWATVTAALVTAALLISCAAPSYIVRRQPNAGLNGSFEVVSTGYPVNWSFSASPIQDGSMVVSLDGENVQDGSQSLKIEARSDSQAGEVFYQVWSKPSFSARTSVQAGKLHRIGFWLRSLGAEVHVRWVTTSEDYQQHYRHKDLVAGDLPEGEWVLIEDFVTIEDSEALLELIFVATRTGVFWCDGVQVEEVAPST
jgi:hypothetical protein